MNMRPFKNRAETFVGVCILVALGTLSTYLAVFLLFLGVCAYLYLQYESHNLNLHLEVVKSVITSTTARLQPTMSSFIRSVQQRTGLMSDETKSEMHISRADSPVTSRLRRVSIASSGSRYERSRSEFSLSRGNISSPTRSRLSPANRSVLDVYNRGDSRSPQRSTYSETLGYSYKSSPWNRSAYSSSSENNRTSNTNVKTVQNVGGPLLATSRGTPNKTFDLRLYADANSPGLASRSVYYSQMSGGRTIDENRRPLSPLLPTHQPQYHTVGQFPIVRLNQKGGSANSLPVLTAAVSPKAPRAHGLSSVNLSSSLMECAPSTHVTPVVISPHPAVTPGVTPHEFSSPAADTSDPQDICAKSIIEALKEISRKRIRSQCLTPNEVPDDEAAKRQRRNASLDSIYMDDTEAVENSVGPVSHGAYQAKRGRSDSLNSSSDGSERGGVHRGLSGEGSGNLSAARTRAKRLCSNEIQSSLSSSRCLIALAANNKRKFNISPDGTPRSGTPTPLQVGKHFKSGSSPENEQQDEDMVQVTPVKQKEAAVAEEQTEKTPETPQQTQTSAAEVSVSITNSDDTTPEHWKRPAAAVQNGIQPHQATPHPARKVVGARDLAEQRRADRSALVDLLTVIGKGESPFRDKQQSSIAFSSAASTLFSTPTTASVSTSQQQKHVTFSDSTKASELARADTEPIEESQEAPCIGTPASTPQGSMTGTTNTPPTISRTSQRAQSFAQQPSPTGSVMSSFPAVPGTQSGSSVNPKLQTPASGSSSTPAADSTSTTPVSSSKNVTTTSAAGAKPAQSTTASSVADSQPDRTPSTTLTVARKVDQDVASKPQQQLSTATSVAFSFGAPKVSTAASAANTATSSSGFNFQPSSVPPTNIFGGSPKSTSQSVTNTSSSTTTAAGGFQFAAKLTTASAAPTSGAGGFQFAYPSSTGTSTASAPKATFQFAQSSTPAGGSNKPGGFSFSAGATEKINIQGVTSGSGVVTSQITLFGSTAPQSTSAASTTTTTPVFGSASTSQSQAPGMTPTSLPSFGSAGQKTFGAVPSQALSSAVSTATTQQSIFGASGNTTTPSSSQAATFTSTTQSAVFAAPAFVPSTQSPSKPAFQTPSFGSTSTTQSQIFGSNTPTFGGNTTPQASAFTPASTSQTQTFGSTTTSQTPVFGSVSTSQTSTFAPGSTPGFGSASTNQAPAFGSGSGNPTGIFGSGSTNPAPTFGSGSSNQTPAFGSGSGIQTPAFGSGSTGQTLAFGSSSQNPTPSFASGASGQTPAFGSSGTTQPASFGSGSGQTPGFGTSGSKQTPAFGSVTQASGFPSGSSSQGPTFGSGPSQPSAFGSVANKPLTFGASSSEVPSAFGSTSQTSLFGSSSSQPFGGTGSAPATTQSATFGSSTPAFGAGGSNQAPAFGTASPFGSSISSTPTFGSPFGSSTGSGAQATAADNKTLQFPATTTTVSQPSVFAFAGPSSTAGTAAPAGSAAPFQFGGSGQSASSAAPKPGGFQFGQQAAGSSAPFMFGSSTAAPAAPSPAFQFNASGSTPAGGSVPNMFAAAGATGNVGMFSIGSGSTAPRTRVTRPRKAR